MPSVYFDNNISVAPAHHLEAMIVSAIDAIIALDARQRIICFNPAAERMFGLPADKALGQPIKRFIPDGWHADPDAHARIADRRRIVAGRAATGSARHRGGPQHRAARCPRRQASPARHH